MSHLPPVYAMRSILRMPQSRAPPPSALVYGSVPAAFSIFDTYGVQSRSSLGRRGRESSGSSSSNATTLDGNETDDDDWDVLYTRSRRQVGLYLYTACIHCSNLITFSPSSGSTRRLAPLVRHAVCSTTGTSTATTSVSMTTGPLSGARR
jgi:hypothetical protein